MTLLTRRRAPMTVASLVLAGVLGACGWHPNSLYVETPYTGVWRHEMISDNCGIDTVEDYTGGTRFTFNAYDERFYFNFEVINGILKTKYRESVLAYNGINGLFLNNVEISGVSINLSSYEKALGTWSTKNCHGKIEMTKIS